MECPDYHHICKETRKTESHFICESCFFQGNAEDVGAINILARTLKVMQDEGQDMVHACTGRETTAWIACVSELPAAGAYSSDLLMNLKRDSCQAL
jgi:putative transposase